MRRGRGDGRARQVHVEELRGCELRAGTRASVRVGDRDDGLRVRARVGLWVVGEDKDWAADCG